MEKVYAMSFTRQKALERLDALSLEISEHLFKLVLLPKHQSVPHWQHELKTWRRNLTRCNNSKAKKPNYNKATLKQYLFKEPLGTKADLDILKKILEDEYSLQIKTIPDLASKLEKKMDAYIDSILKNNDNWLL
jgi:ribosomal protein L29